MVGTAKQTRKKRAVRPFLVMFLVIGLLVSGAPQILAQSGVEFEMETSGDDWAWQNPNLAPNPYNNIHNDSWFTDTYTNAGPENVRSVDVEILSSYSFTDPTTGLPLDITLGVCAAHTYDADGNLLTVCAGLADLQAKVWKRNIVAISPEGELIAWAGFDDPYTSVFESLTDFSGVGYFYLDNQYRIVMGMPDGHIVTWQRTDSALSDVDQWVAVADINVTGEGGPIPSDRGELYALVSNEAGYIWFTTTKGVIGTIAPNCAENCLRWIDVNDTSDNPQTFTESHSVNGNSAFQQSDYYMYRFDMADDGTPVIAWQEAYDRGTGVKSGQTSQGSGTSPSYFEMGGREFVTIADNAELMHINVYRAESSLAEGESRLFTSVAPFGEDKQVSDENSLIVYPGSTANSRRIYAENNWGNNGFISTAGPLVTRPGFNGIEVHVDGTVEVLNNNTNVRVPSVVSKGNIPSNALYTYEKRVTGWYLTALDPANPVNILWSARVGGGAARYNNWYSQLSMAPDGRTFFTASPLGVIMIRTTEGPERPRICVSLTEPEDFAETMLAIANYQSGPTYYPEYLEAAFVGWEHDFLLIGNVLESDRELATLPESIRESLYEITPLLDNLYQAEAILSAVGYDPSQLSAENKAALAEISVNHRTLIEAALIAYIVLCTDVDISDLIENGGQNLRVMLYRSYLPTGGFDNVPLPDLTLVRNGVETQLPICPKFTDNSIWSEVHTTSNSLIGIILRMIVKHKLHDLGEDFPFCAWWTLTTVDNFNIAAPDENAAYWAVPLVASDDLEIYIDGVYPDERYMSLTLYNPSVNPYEYNEVDSWIADYQINPNAGSQNPWQVEADPGGSYRVTIKADPQNGEANVLPWFFTSAEGRRGTMPAPCATEGAESISCPLPNMFISPPQDDQSSIFSNPDNRYMMNIFRPDHVYVLRGKLPTTPFGTHPVPWPDDDYQLRYFSICDIAYVRPYFAMVENGCVVDYQIPTDENGMYTIVYSTLEQRPSNATLENGIGWVRAYPGIRNFLVMRHMLPNENFSQAAQNVPQDAAWTSGFTVMGEYYPVTTIECNTAAFEDNPQHCWVPNDIETPPIGVNIY